MAMIPFWDKLTRSPLTYLLVTALLYGYLLARMEPVPDQADLRQLDALEYQTTAINLLEHGRFPVQGIIGDTADYFMWYDYEAKSLINDTHYRQYKQAGPVVNLSKPPVYSLYVAVLYTVLGYSAKYIVYLNLFWVCLIGVFQPYVARKLFGNWGLPLGLYMGYTYVQSNMVDIIYFYPHILAQVLLLALFVLEIEASAKKIETTFSLVGRGILLGIMLLMNGNTVFIVGLYVVYCLLAKRPVKNIGKLAGGIAVVLLPWMLFANYTMHTSKTERHAWRERVMEGYNPIMTDQPFLVNDDMPTPMDSLIMSNFIKQMYAKFADDGYILISKQPFGDEILSVHNEYSYNGFHPEWRYLSHCYYNRHPSKAPAVWRIFGFYVDNPYYFHENIIGKFMGIDYPHAWLYYWSIILLGALAMVSLTNSKPLLLLISAVTVAVAFLPFEYFVWAVLFFCALYNLLAFRWLKKEPQVPLLLAAALTNVTLITIIFLGEPRYVRIVDPLVMCGGPYIFTVLVTHMYKKLKRVEHSA